VLENFKDWALKAVNCQVITIAKDDVGFFKLPRRKIRKYFRNNKYDIAIDFNRGGTVFSAILCALCGAGIRIGFAGGGSERFLNYLISPQSGVAEERFRALLSYVGMS
jgi:ADP-heptose:LPS heptosyltransferase